MGLAPCRDFTMSKTLSHFSILSASIVIFVAAGAFGETASSSLGLTRDNPWQIDEKTATLSFLAEVNGRFLTRSTRHTAAFRGGTLGNRAIFRAFIDHKTFHESLKKIGAQPGNNMTFENMEKTHVLGTELDVSVTWEGAKKEYTLDEVIKDSNGKPIRMRFGGNLAEANEHNSGCLMCLDSCPVGIASNASYTYGSVEMRGEVRFVGKKEVLPPNGTLVVIKVKVKK